MVNKFTGSAITTGYHLAPALMETVQRVKTIWPVLWLTVYMYLVSWMSSLLCCRLLGANATADILQLSNSLSGSTRLHLVSGDELRVITRSSEPIENLLSVCCTSTHRHCLLNVFCLVLCWNLPLWSGNIQISTPDSWQVGNHIRQKYLVFIIF